MRGSLVGWTNILDAGVPHLRLLMAALLTAMIQLFSYDFGLAFSPFIYSPIFPYLYNFCLPYQLLLRHYFSTQIHCHANDWRTFDCILIF